VHPRLLKTFLAVARTRNVTRAGEALHLAQSSVSDQIQALEADLGVPLFVRGRQGLSLTPAGDALRPYAQELLALADEARAAATAGAALAPRPLALGALETIAPARLPQWLEDLRRRHALLRVNLDIAGSGALLQGVADGMLDAAFCFARGRLDARLAHRVLRTEPLALVGPPSARADAAPPSARQFIATQPGCVYREMLDAACAQAGLRGPAIAAEVGSLAAIARLAAAGEGCALLPRLAVQAQLERGELAELPWPGPAASASLILVWRRRRAQPPALANLLEAARDWAAAVTPAGAPLPRAAPFPS